jgi:hypothetical protein
MVAGTSGVYIFNLADFSVQQYITSYASNCFCYNLSRISLANNILYISSGTSNLVAYSAEGLWKFTVNHTGGAHGVPAPYYYGTNYALTNAVITESVPATVAEGILTRHVARGWTGTGSLPASGTSNSVTFAITNDSQLTWNWQTEHWLTVDVMSKGSVDVDDSWQLAGSTVTLTATPSNYYHFAYWSGDVSETSNVLPLQMTAPRRVTANFEANVVTNGVPEWWLAENDLSINDAGALADTDGDGVANWKEYRAGTDPRDANSIFRVSVVPPPSWDPIQYTIRWPATYGRFYTLWSATNLNHGFSVLASNLWPTPPTNYFYRNAIPGYKEYYFIEVE